MTSFEVSLKPVLTKGVAGMATAVAGLSPMTALAHWGHLGELAGHGHLVAAGLAAAAAVAAAGVAVVKPQDAPSTNDDAEAEEPTNSGEQANA